MTIDDYIRGQGLVYDGDFNIARYWYLLQCLEDLKWQVEHPNMIKGHMFANDIIFYHLYINAKPELKRIHCLDNLVYSEKCKHMIPVLIQCLIDDLEALPEHEQFTYIASYGYPE